MTDLVPSTSDLSAFEDDLAGGLLIDPEVQDLLFRMARTPQHFTDAPVSEAALRAVHDLVKWAPTSRNGQPLRLVLARTANGRERVLRHLTTRNQAKASSAPLLAVLAVDATDPDAVGSGWLQIGYFLVGLRAAGLSALPMGGIDASGLDHEFFPGGQQRTLLVIALGYATESAYRPRQPRLDYDEVVSTV